MNDEFNNFLSNPTLVALLLKKFDHYINNHLELKERKLQSSSPDKFSQELLHELYCHIQERNKEGLRTKMTALFCAIKDNRQDRLNEELNYLMRTYENLSKDKARSEEGSFSHLYRQVQQKISEYRKEYLYIKGKMYGKKGMLPEELIYPKGKNGQPQILSDTDELNFTCPPLQHKDFYSQYGKLRKKNIFLLLDNLYPEYLNYYEKKELFYNIMAIQLFVEKLCATYSFLKGKQYSIGNSDDNDESSDAFSEEYFLDQIEKTSSEIEDTEKTLSGIEEKEIYHIVKNYLEQIPSTVRQCYYLNAEGKTFEEISDLLHLGGSQNARNRAKKFEERIKLLYMEQGWDEKESAHAVKLIFDLLKSDCLRP